VLVTDGANNGEQIDPITAARLAANEGVRIYTIGIGSDPDKSGIQGLLGLNPSLDLDEPTLKDIASLSGGQYFRARDGEQLEKIRATLDSLEPVAQQPTQARPAQVLYQWPLSLALLLSVLLVIRSLWPNNAVQRALVSLRAFGWRERVERLWRSR
ncbi:VWA domain-containing protein, partial [Pseudomonas viridiflava]|uniref:VWA domain-containing protein n=1 Tax=Pseudomonas viridiflava TaxID=33069 RepID=UPI000F025C16